MEAKTMKIRWYGHSCFMLTDSNGVRVLTDPCDPGTGYKLSGIETDVVTISHGHHDHNYMEAVSGSPEVINTAGKHEFRGVKITGFETFHDDCGGKKRGENIMFIYEMDDMRVLHAGDLGAVPDTDTIEALGRVDVLLVPVGGVFTVNYMGAREFANAVKPKVVIPMHYKTPALSFGLETVDEFLKSARDCKIHRLNQCEATLTTESLGDDRILVMDYFER